MAKTQQQKKRKRATQAAEQGPFLGTAHKRQQNLPSPPNSNPDSTIISTAADSSQAIDEIDLAITLETLSKCIAEPSLLTGPAMKPLRTALHLLSGAYQTDGRGPVIASSGGAGEGLIANISSCLRSSDWTRALLLLEQLRTAEVPIKLGTLQRWIRDCDSVAAAGEDGNGGGADPEVYIVIDKIMRTVDRIPRPTRASGTLEDVLIRHPPWAPTIEFNERAEDWNGSSALANVKSSDFRICATTPGAERLPPNHFPAVIYTSSPGSIPLTPLSSRTAVTSRPVPSVPGALFLTNVFSIAECATFVRVAEQVGMLPDEPLSTSSAANLSSVLAHNFYWLADTKFMGHLIERLRPCLPDRVDGGRQLTGINARFRLYRYKKGSVYRPHIDGAWPPSGLDPSAKSGEDYRYDVSPPERKEWSRFTLLLYLNDGFEGGCTTFFTPNRQREGVLDAWPVKPVIGCGLVFPHGVSDGSLVHEGSGVTGEGQAKYIIRTDVLYTREPVL